MSGSQYAIASTGGRWGARRPAPRRTGEPHRLQLAGFLALIGGLSLGAVANGQTAPPARSSLSSPREPGADGPIEVQLAAQYPRPAAPATPLPAEPAVDATPGSEYTPLLPMIEPLPVDESGVIPPPGTAAAPVVAPPVPPPGAFPIFPTPLPPTSTPVMIAPDQPDAAVGPGRLIFPGDEGADGDPDLRELPSALDESGQGILSSAIETQARLTVIVGRSKVFQLKRPVTRVLVDNPRVADIQLLDADKPEPRLLNLFGLSFGRATVTFWDRDENAMAYEVEVVINEKELEQKVRDVIPGTNVTVRQVAQQVVLEGQVADIQMMAQVIELVQSELRLTGQASVGSLAGAVGVGAGGGTGGPSGGGAEFQGQSPLGVANTANAQPGLVIVNRVRVPGPRQVMLKVKIAELNRTAMRQIGVSWLDTRNNAFLGSPIGGAATFLGNQLNPFPFGGGSANAAFSPAALVPGAIATPIPERILSAGFAPAATAFGATAGAMLNPSATLFGIFNAGEFNLFINALRSNSLAKILSEPNLIALDGQPASFQAGGRFPYPVAQVAGVGGGAAISIEWEKFGAILEFLPNIMPNSVIRLDVAPTFSELNFGAGFAIPGVGVVPGITQRTARTVVELREGQTLAIAGLLSTRTNASTVRVPGLGDLPIVGPLFSRNEVETIETELVVLVTPEFVEPMDHHEVPPVPGDMVEEPNNWEFYFLGRIEGKTGNHYRATVDYQDPLNVMKHFQSESRWVVGPHGHAD